VDALTLKFWKEMLEKIKSGNSPILKKAMAQFPYRRIAIDECCNCVRRGNDFFCVKADADCKPNKCKYFWEVVVHCWLWSCFFPQTALQFIVCSELHETLKVGQFSKNGSSGQ
jgi:hypothetical protein